MLDQWFNISLTWSIISLTWSIMHTVLTMQYIEKYNTLFYSCKPSNSNIGPILVGCDLHFKKT